MKGEGAGLAQAKGLGEGVRGVGRTEVGLGILDLLGWAAATGQK